MPYRHATTPQFWQVSSAAHSLPGGCAGNGMGRGRPTALSRAEREALLPELVTFVTGNPQIKTKAQVSFPLFAAH